MSGQNVVVAGGSTGAELYKLSTDAASICKSIVVASAKPIQGRKYVQVEGWQAIAIAHGCVASSGEVERVEGGFRAIGRVIKMDTGTVIATAEGFVGDDEAMWAKRPVFARRAMAQTRSISRACRSAFAHVVVMMNAGLETTPSEEMESTAEQEVQAPKRAAKAKDMGEAERIDPPKQPEVWQPNAAQQSVIDLMLNAESVAALEGMAPAIKNVCNGDGKATLAMREKYREMLATLKAHEAQSGVTHTIEGEAEHV